MRPSRPRGVRAAARRFEAALAAERAGRLDEAALRYRRVVDVAPRHDGALGALGLLAYQAGDLGAAIRWLERAAEAAPTHACNLGNVLAASGDRAGALTAYRRAIAAAPPAPEPHNGMGAVLQADGRAEAAERAYREALRVDPEYAGAWYNLGTLLLPLGRLDEAEQALRRAIALRPGYVEAYVNAGTALMQLGRLPEAAGLYAEATDTLPFESLTSRIGHWAWSNRLFLENYRTDSRPEEVAELHRRWGRAVVSSLEGAPVRAPPDRSPERRLRIGYVSPDLWSHPVARFLLPILERRDRDRFEVICYSVSHRSDGTTAELREHADQWRVVPAMEDRALAELVRQDGVDILVDLAGHTAENRLGIFARRAAPVQLTYLGYPNSTGLPTVDARLTDEIADPGAHDARYTETLVRLAGGFLCFRPPSDAPDVAPPPLERHGYPTYGSFNNLVKMGPDVLSAWARILERVPGARLVLKAGQLRSADVCTRVHAAFAQEGIDPARIELRATLDSPREHLDFYRCIDVALDTFPYNGTTTTCEALWMGVPVVTFPGSTHAGRVGASLLTNGGLPELVAPDEDGYEALAIARATDGGALGRLRLELRARLRESALLDGARLTRAVEAAYRTLWRGWCGG